MLAGGRARRMGGTDKGLLPIAGRPMIAYVLEALRPQVDCVLINANRNMSRYAAFGVPVLVDRIDGYQGPLAGMASALAAADTPLLLTVPCDAPLLPSDLARRLLGRLQQTRADVAVASIEDRLQPVFLLMRCSVLPGLEAELAAGERKIDRWIGRQPWVSVDLSDRADALLNVNSPADVAGVAARLGRG